MEGVIVPVRKTIIDINGCHSNESRGDHCGYCKGKKSNPGANQWGISSNKMSVSDYQKLIDRGWRRCGTYYYKYDFEQSCCQPYTIRLDTSEFHISHSQRKVMKRFNKFLLGEIDSNGQKVNQKMDFEELKKEQSKIQDQDAKQMQQAQLMSLLSDILANSPELQLFIDDERMNKIIQTSIFNKPRDKELKDTKSWSTNGIMRLYFSIKDLKKEAFTQSMKDFVGGLKSNEKLITNQDKSLKLEDNGYLTFINLEKDSNPEKPKTQKQKPNKKKGQQEEEKKKYEEDANMNSAYNEDLLYSQYFKEFAPLKLQPGQKLKHKYTVQITKALTSEESFKVYQKYQDKVHGESEKSISGYSKFLCNCPLFDPNDKVESDRPATARAARGNIDQGRVKKDEGVWPEYLGGYHMIHKLDGEIFAVGVLDYTPNVLSSVYLYYDPKYEFLSPGTFSAVREIEYSLRIQKVFNADFKYYYMGLYFQDCQKSVYKGTYQPSQVLCPRTYNYVYLTDEIRQKISKEKRPLLSDQPLIKELNLTENQVNTLVENFKFCYDKKMMLKINALDKAYVPQIKKMVKDLYLNLGLDVMLSSFFVV